MKAPLTVAIVTGSLAPYSQRLYEAYTDYANARVHVFECARVEPGRKWLMSDPKNFSLISLAGFRFHRTYYSHIYFNPSVILRLAKLAPSVIVIDSFSPTMLLAAAFAFMTRTPLGLGVEGSRELDPGENSFVHAFFRRFIGRRASFGICTSEGAQVMMESWGLPRSRTCISPHAGAWDPPERNPDFSERPFDLLFCGTLNDRKNPLFLLDVMSNLKAAGIKPRLRIVGEGELREPLQRGLREQGIEAQFDGYLQPPETVDAYSSAKIMLFPTLGDTWGLVANEALACGTAVIASPHAVSSAELVERYGVGLVRPLIAQLWADEIRGILASATRWRSFSKQRQAALERFSLKTSVENYGHAVAIGLQGHRA